MEIIRGFLLAGYRITFASAAQKTPYSAELKSLGVKEQHVELNHSSFDEFLTESRPDLVIFDRFMVEEQYGWRVASQLPKTIRILDTEDLHSLRRSREGAVSKGLEFSLSSWKQSDLAKRELASIWRSDLSLIISQFEYDILKSEFDISDQLLQYLPFIENSNSMQIERAATSFEERKDFIWIGNGKHNPNADALLWLKQAIRLYSQPSAWKEARQAGREALELLLDENHFEKLLARIDTLSQQLSEERAENFIGAMLWHHSMSSTRYFTKWIEAKNSKS